MTPSASERPEPESYNKLMLWKTGRFKIVEVSATKIMIDEPGIGNTVSIKRATMPPSAKFAERQPLYTPSEPAGG